MQVLESAKRQAVFSPLLRRYSLEELWSLPDPPDRAHYELIEGVLFMVPPPDDPHDDIDERLNRSLVLFLASGRIHGMVYHPRASISTQDTYLEPDMMYVSTELRERMRSRRTSADVVFEYLSKSNKDYDRTTKADTCLALGIRELWLVDADTKSIEIRNAVPSQSADELPRWEVRQYGEDEVAESKVLQGWRVPLVELFERLD